MNKLAPLFITVVLGVMLTVLSVQAADQKTTLMLGGKFCEFYPNEITVALMAVKGVKSVDINSMGGQAIVAHDGTVKPDALIEAMKGVKGTKAGVDWYCTAELMK
jgi:mercuric ion binding protein